MQSSLQPQRFDGRFIFALAEWGAETADRSLSTTFCRAWISPHRSGKSNDIVAPVVVDTTFAGKMALAKHLDNFLSKREPPKTFCPSEVARALTQDEMKGLGLEEWRDAMPDVRELAWTLRDRGECEILQKGEVIGDNVGPEDIKGPIRIRRTNTG